MNKHLTALVLGLTVTVGTSHAMDNTLEEASTFLEDGQYNTRTQSPSAAYCDELVTFTADKIYLEATDGSYVDCSDRGEVYSWDLQPDGTYALGSKVLKILNSRTFLIVNRNLIFRKISD